MRPVRKEQTYPMMPPGRRRTAAANRNEKPFMKCSVAG